MKRIQHAITSAAASARQHLGLFGTRGVLRRALINLPGVSQEFRAPIPNSSSTVVLRLGTTDVAAFEHVFVNQEYGFVLPTAPSIIVDAGANVGMSAVYFSQRYPTARIVAVEPDPANFSILIKNALLFPNIQPVHAALWNQDGEVVLEDAGTGSWGFQTKGSRSIDIPQSSVRAIKLRTLLKEYDIPQIDLLKMDVEGAECEILEDASEWISQVGAICAELHDRFRPGCSTAFEAATHDFPVRWRRGELLCAAREV